MNITFLKKLSVLRSALLETFRMPGFKRTVVHFINPVDSIRYTELAYFLGFFGAKLKKLNVLDVSSPHVAAYILSRDNKVVKMNVDAAENRFIRENKNLKFCCANALDIPFSDGAFDLTYSISVVEHIYAKYADAVSEMLRVTRPGGYVYLTFPVSTAHIEEWLPYPIYPAQEKTAKGFFFQYRFSKSDVDALLAASGAAEVVDRSIYWERVAGDYDSLISMMRENTGIGVVNLLRNALLNIYSGFLLLDNQPGEFEGEHSFGNISIILKKRG